MYKVSIHVSIRRLGRSNVIFIGIGYRFDHFALPISEGTIPYCDILFPVNDHVGLLGFGPRDPCVETESQWKIAHQLRSTLYSLLP